jgi:hypothetical protein
MINEAKAKAEATHYEAKAKVKIFKSEAKTKAKLSRSRPRPRSIYGSQDPIQNRQKCKDVLVLKLQTSGINSLKVETHEWVSLSS